MNGRMEKEIQAKQKMQKKLANMPDIFAEFYYYMYPTKTYTTLDRYISYVHEFALFVGDGNINEDFYKDVRPIHINKYFAQIKNYEGKKITSDSICATKWSALNTFFIFLKKNNYILSNPLEKTERPKVNDNPNVSFLTMDEVHSVLDNVNKIASLKMKNRDLAIIMLGLTTGIRVSALVQINLQDIDFDNNIIKVVEKRNKICDIYIGDKLKQQILLWVEDRQKFFHDANTDALFLSSFNQRITRDGIRVILEKYCSGIVNKHVTPHVMRHTCATNLYESTGDIYLCASMLHHKNISTTQRYAEISQNKKKHAVGVLENLIE